MGVLLFFGIIFSFLSDAEAGIHRETPREADLIRPYLFYMHGAWIEKNGLNRPHPSHGYYEYDSIVRVFQESDFEVTSEMRPSEVHPLKYATEIADEVRVLLNQGVPPQQITVCGHSKGGQMTLIVASLVGEEKVNYVVLAGCGKRGTSFRQSYEKFLASQAPSLKGRILSMYDADDREAGSCQEAFRLASGIETKERVLHTGKGHGLFYSPQAVWVNPLLEWVRHEKSYV